MSKVTLWHKNGESVSVEPVDARELMASGEYSEDEVKTRKNKQTAKQSDEDLKG